MQCPFHKIELVHRQGISKKTGKEYNFFACPNKDENGFCKFTENGIGSLSQKDNSNASPSILERLSALEMKVANLELLMDQNREETAGENLPF